MNGYDFDGNRHGRWVEVNPDGSIKRDGHYDHGTFYTEKAYQKRKDPVRRDVLRALMILEKLPIQSGQAKGRWKHTQQSIARLYQAVQQNIK